MAKKILTSSEDILGAVCRVLSKGAVQVCNLVIAPHLGFYRGACVASVSGWSSVVVSRSGTRCGCRRSTRSLHAAGGGGSCSLR